MKFSVDHWWSTWTTLRIAALDRRKKMNLQSSVFGLSARSSRPLQLVMSTSPLEPCSLRRAKRSFSPSPSPNLRTVALANAKRRTGVSRRWRRCPSRPCPTATTRSRIAPPSAIWSMCLWCGCRTLSRTPLMLILLFGPQSEQVWWFIFFFIFSSKVFFLPWRPSIIKSYVFVLACAMIQSAQKRYVCFFWVFVAENATYCEEAQGQSTAVGSSSL